MKKIATLFAGILLTTTLSTFATAEVAYVSDVVLVPVRSGAGNQFRIVHAGLRSGTQLEVHETEGDWARITADNGLEGWMPTQYLSKEPPARSQLVQASQRLSAIQQQNAALTAQVRELEQQNKNLQAQVRQLENTSTEATEELAEVKALSSDALNLNRRHRELLEEHQMLQTNLDTLRAENDRLKNDNTISKWLYGAGLVVLGIFLSIIIPALKPKKRFSDWA